MEIKKLEEKDYMESLKLSMYAFQYEVAEEDVSDRKERLKRQTVFGIWEQDNLAAKLHIIPLNVMVNNQEWKMGGIAGVATYPEYRRKGYVKQLIKHSLIEMNEAGQTFSFLHPFDISFYRNFGWEVFTDYKKVVIEKIDLQMLGSITGTIKRYKKSDHSPVIEEIYKDYIKQFSGCLIRDTQWWKDSVYSDYQIAVFFNENQNGRGYILYKVNDKLMEIEEFVALDQEARRNLWNFICQHDSMVDKVTVLTSIHDHFPYYLKQPKLKMDVFPYFMARIVNVEKCLNQFTFLNTEDRVFLHIEDQYAPWNNGSYLISSNGISVFKEKHGSQCTQPAKRGIHMNVNTLTAILMGYKRPLELYDMEEIKGAKKDAEVLEKKLPIQKTFFYDFF